MSKQEKFALQSAEELAEKIAPFVFDSHPHDGCTCAEVLLVLAAFLSSGKKMFLCETLVRLNQIYQLTEQLFDDTPLNNKKEVIAFWKSLVKKVIKEEEKNRET